MISSLHKFLSAAVLLMLPAIVQAQQTPMAAFLAHIEAHNPLLVAAQHANQALLADRRADNLPGRTSAEYSPFYTADYRGVASSELVVQQEFDFPTLYAARSHSATALQHVLEAQYATLRRDVMLSAVCNLCDLCDANQRLALLRQRQASADSLLVAYLRRLAEGDATLIDVNRIRLDQMTARTELLQANASRDEFINLLVQLNGGSPVADPALFGCTDPSGLTTGTILASDSLPDPHTAFGHSHEVREADAALRLSEREVSEARQGWLPQLSVGYRRNTEGREALNGFIVGVSLPLFGNKNKVKAARLRSEAASSERDEAIAAFDAEQQSLKSRYHKLGLMLDAYDEDLMRQQLTLLERAVTAGELSVIEYYNETDRIYALLLERLSLQTEYYKARARLYRDWL